MHIGVSGLLFLYYYYYYHHNFDGYGYGCRINKPLACICTLSAAYVCYTATHTYGGVTQLEASVPHGECFLASALHAAEAVLSTPHSCRTTACRTHCSPAHAHQCPLRIHRLITVLNTLWQTLYIILFIIKFDDLIIKWMWQNGTVCIPYRSTLLYEKSQVGKIRFRPLYWQAFRDSDILGC